MIKSFRDYLKKSVDNKKEPSDKELKLAAAALMFEVINSDGKIERHEVVAMGEVLRQQFQLEDKDIESIMILARESAQDSSSLEEFTKAICENWGNSKRAILIEHLWVLALSDKEIDQNERNLVRKIAGQLSLNEGQIVNAREKAKEKLGISDFD